MSYAVQLSDEAIADYDEAVSWYERQKTGLGFDFSFRLTETLELIEAFPAAQQLLYGNKRCAHLKQFPYKVFFVFEENEPDIVVFAILHDKRHPGMWRKRSTQF